MPIHDANTMLGYINRIENLTPDSQHHWGKMNVAQMMAHCSNAFESALGDKPGKQVLMGKIFGKIAKKELVSDRPIKKGIPTDNSFLVPDQRDFDTEKQRLIDLVKRMAAADPALMSRNIHPFFGKMAPDEWSALNSKHLDHHLRQFGV